VLRVDPPKLVRLRRDETWHPGWLQAWRRDGDGWLAYVHRCPPAAAVPVFSRGCSLPSSRHDRYRAGQNAQLVIDGISER
jgi:hypothetical protein